MTNRPLAAPTVFWLAAAVASALSTPSCGGGGIRATTDGGAGGTGGGMGKPKPGGPGMGGAGGIATGSGAGGAAGAVGGEACVPGVQQAIITDCGYPFSSSNPLTSVVFNESEVLRAIQPGGSSSTGIVRMFYNDEHALTLGVRQVVVKSASGTTTTDYPVSPLLTNPSHVDKPQTGSNELAGDQSGLDASLRPMWPALYLTDLTGAPNSRAGDWQYGGRPRNPDAIFGSWKAAVRTVDATKTPKTSTITPDADPTKNNWDLAGGDPVPAGLENEGYGAEARWNVNLTPGHSYRIQVIVHDGDQNKVGGDSGEACVIFCAGGGISTGEGGGSGTGEGGSSGTGAGGQGGSTACPAGTVACGGGGIDPVACPATTVCANGCCLSIVP